jgi:hypothetical protein
VECGRLQRGSGIFFIVLILGMFFCLRIHISAQKDIQGHIYSWKRTHTYIWTHMYTGRRRKRRRYYFYYFFWLTCISTYIYKDADIVERGPTHISIGEPVEMLSFFLVLKLRNNSKVDLLYRAKEIKIILYYTRREKPCSKGFFSFP